MEVKHFKSQNITSSLKKYKQKKKGKHVEHQPTIFYQQQRG